ncbi:hypothetical protein D6C85_04248 [Aureobasidium pullulans]|uniref:Uncharacterized protein n=1 Tax=Aureobasidium pullulans TaxID=5580 RepID=A0A4S9X3W9_AURPU|nr:hypothetical protein D6C85_04248 [Aureobasidium pullulans]
MFRSLSSKNSGSSSKRKKSDQSSRRTESVASSSAHRKHARNDERSSKHASKKSTSTQPPVNGSPNYYTTSEPLNQLEPLTLTEEAIRTLSMQEDGWGDTYSRAGDLPSADARADRKDYFDSSYNGDAGQKYGRTLQYHSSGDESSTNERALNLERYPQNSFGTSSHVQDQFPGQNPATYAQLSFGPMSTQGQAGEYFVGDQSRPRSSFASTPANQFPQSNAGAAAEYYSQSPMQPSEAVNQQPPSQSFNPSQNPSTRPDRLAEPSVPSSSAYSQPAIHVASASNGSYPVHAMNNLTGQVSPSQQHRPAEATGTGRYESHDVYSQSPHAVPSMPVLLSHNNGTPLAAQYPGKGKQQAVNHTPQYAAATAGVAAGVYGHHHHKTHQHNHSAPIGTIGGATMYGNSPPRPYTSGGMATQHRHKGPISKFVDWWKDHEDVRKMEEYTEYIGVCKYCFDPRSNASDAPRKHNRGSRRSSDSLRRRSGDSLHRSYTNGSRNSRVDKDARYHSSDSERRSTKSSWLGAGIAAYGISKVGKSLWQNSRDFDDTYSVKSGRMDEASKTASHRNGQGNRASSHERRTTDYRSVNGSASARFETDHRISGRRSDHSGSESRRSRDDRSKATKSGRMAAEGPPSEERIHVRHPSPGSRLTSQPRSPRGHKSRSRSQSPSLGQILGLTSSQKRTAAKASRSSSPQQQGMFTGLFSKQRVTTRPKKSKRKGFFNFANSSSSSANSELAFGSRTMKNGQPSKTAARKSSDEHLKATLLGIGATAAALSAMQRSRPGSKRLELKDVRNRSSRYDTKRSKHAASEEEGWESATEDESDSASSGLAFGDYDIKGKAPRRQPSSESITSQSSGTDKWSWRWRRKSAKKGSTDDMPHLHRDDSHVSRDSNVTASQPLQYVHPAPMSSPMHSDAHGPSSMPGAFPEQAYTTEAMPIQQPQPIMALRPSIFDTQNSPYHAHPDQSSPRTSARPPIPTELRRTQSSPISNHTTRNAAIIGLAGAVTAGILSSNKSRDRDDSPSNVRFELTEKQAKKEERQQRNEDAKDSKERARQEARESKERARADRERAMHEESRLADEIARRQAEESERHKILAEQAEKQQTQMREAAAAEAREREADRQREEEIKRFMQNALAEQAREAEKQRVLEAWQAQQTAGARQDSAQKPWGGPSTAPRPSVVDTKHDHDNHRQDTRSNPAVPYATRSYEPSNEHSGQPLMDDDLIDPDFFTRRRSHSDLARHDELARKAAAKVVADLEDRYRDPTPSQAEFFAPKELFEPSKGKTKVHGPVDDTDYQVYHIPEVQLASMPNEPPPPYQAPYQYSNLRDEKRMTPWDVPKLNVIAPTPPTSYAGSARDDKSPVSASRRAVREGSQESDVEFEPQKSSKVSWGEDQTRFYEITTPESSQEYVVLPDEIPHGISDLRTEYVHTAPSQEEPDRNWRVTSDQTLDHDRPDESIEEIPREAPSTASDQFYRQPFVESVSDVAFTLDSPGTEGAPPVQGFVEGEVNNSSESDEHMPHVPGGFDDPESDTVYTDHKHERASSPQQNANSFNHDAQQVESEVTQDRQPPEGLERSQSVEQDQDDYFMTKKERRKRDKAAKKAALENDRGSSFDDHSERSTMSQPTVSERARRSSRDENKDDYEASSPMSKDEPRYIDSDTHRSSSHVEAAATAGAAATIGTLIHKDRSRSPTRRKSEPEDFDRQRPQSAHSEPRDTISQSTPTSPVYERRPSLPSHAFDDLDMLPGSKRPKKSKRNSLLNYPAVGSPLRSAMTWDEYIEPISVTQNNEPTGSRSYEPRGNAGPPDEDKAVETGKDLPSPESERDATSVVSAPVGEEDGSRRRKIRKSHREREGSTSPRRSSSVAASEPYESSRKHKHRSRRDGEDVDDQSSVISARSRSSHSSRKDDDDSKSKKKGGILSLFRRKTSDDMVSEEKKRLSDDAERSKHHHRRRSSEQPIDDYEERRSSTSRSRSHVDHDASSRHSSSSRHHRRHHRDQTVDDDASSQISESKRRHKHHSRDNSRSPEEEFDDTRSATSESRRKHRHRHRDDDSEHKRSISRESKSLRDQDQSFLVERVEDEESTPLPEDDLLSSSQTPETVDQPQISALLPEDNKQDSSVSAKPPVLQTSSAELEGLSNVKEHEEVDVAAPEVVEATSSTSPTEGLSPTSEHMTPARPIVPLRISSSTAVPFRFRRPPTSPSLPRERSVSFSSPIAPSPSSPITPKAKRPLSTEFMHSTEFRPLYLLERTRKPQDHEVEQNLPSLPPSRSTSSSSLQSSEDWQSAAEDFDPSEQYNSSPPTFDQVHHGEPEDILGSTQTTPKATEFPKDVFEPHHHPHAQPEYYSWSDMEHEEHLRQEAEKGLVEEPRDKIAVTAEGVVERVSAETLRKNNAEVEPFVNQDPMASDVWGDLSDAEDPDTTVDKEITEQILELNPPEVDSSRTSSGKKRKDKKPTKLGTASISDDPDPVRETPAELARRREKDAQDAVDTWFKPAEESSQIKPIDASQVPLPGSSTPFEDEVPEIERPTTPVQEAESSRQESEPMSPLLTRKKSKKGKKKQKSGVLNEPVTEFAPVEDVPEAQTYTEAMPQDDRYPGSEARNEAADLEPTISHGQESRIDVLEKIDTADIATGSTESTSLGQLDEETPAEESSYTMSKAERKKNKKKAKKAALSIAVPVVAADMLLASEDREAEEAEKPSFVNSDLQSREKKENEQLLVQSVEDQTTNEPIEQSIHEDNTPAEAPRDPSAQDEYELASEPITAAQQEIPAEPASEGQVETQTPQHTIDAPHGPLGSTLETLPEDIALPCDTDNDLEEPVLSEPISDAVADMVSTTEPNAEQDQQRPVSQAEPQEVTASEQMAAAREPTTNKRSSWFSWFPGSRSQEVENLKDEPTSSDLNNSSALPQDTFEHLLEQPVQHPESNEVPVSASGLIGDLPRLTQEVADDCETDMPKAVDETLASESEETVASTAEPQIEKTLPPEPEASTDKPNETTEVPETVDSADSDIALLDQAGPEVLRSIPAGEEHVLSSLGVSATEPPATVLEPTEVIPALTQEGSSIASESHEPTPVEDSWSVPSKKGKKGKKGKKAKKEAAFFESAAPSPIDENQSLDAEVPQANYVQYGGSHKVPAAEELEPEAVGVQHVPDLGSREAVDTPSEDTSKSTVEVEELPYFSNIDEAKYEQASTTPGTEIEADMAPPLDDVSATEVRASEIAPIAEAEVVQDEPELVAEPSSAIAEDEWAVPMSKKKGKKGKKGKQSVTEFMEPAEDTLSTQGSVVQQPEKTTTPEDTPITPDIFETPAEGTAAQYFETPVEELTEQVFETPAETSSGQYFDTTADTALSVPTREFEIEQPSEQPQLDSRSVTPTQASADFESAGAQEKTLSQDQTEKADEVVHNLPRKTSMHTEDRKVEEPDVRAGREQHNDETDLQTAHHADVVLQESVFEQSTTAHTDLDDLGEEGSREYTDASQEAESVIEPEESLDVNLEDKESHIEAPAAETSQFHDIAAPEAPFEAFSSKKSKKDKKKAKRSKQRGFEAEPVQDEAIEATSSTAPEELSERSIDVENQEPTTSDFDDTPAPPQMPEAEPDADDYQPFLPPESSIEVEPDTNSDPLDKSDQVAQSSVVQATLTEVAQSSPAEAAIIPETHHNDANTAEPDAIGHMEGLETSCDAKKPGSVDEVLSEDKSEEHTAGTGKLTTESPKPEQAERLSIDEEFGTVDVVEPHKDAQEDIASSIAFGSEHTNLASSVIGEPVDAQVAHPEPAVVEDQAPSVLDQLIMAETISDHNSTEPSEEVETPRNVGDTVPQDERLQAPEEPTHIEPSKELAPTNETTMTQAPETDLPEESLTHQESDLEDRFVPVAAKLSKQEKRKVKKTKQIFEDPLEEFEAVEHPTPGTPSSEQFSKGNLLASVKDSQDPTGISEKFAPQELVEETEPFTAKLSKKAKKKAKKFKTRDASFEPDEEDQSVMAQEQDTKSGASLEPTAEQPPIEPITVSAGNDEENFAGSILPTEPLPEQHEDSPAIEVTDPNTSEQILEIRDEPAGPKSHREQETETKLENVGGLKTADVDSDNIPEAFSQPHDLAASNTETAEQEPESRLDQENDSFTTTTSKKNKKKGEKMKSQPQAIEPQADEGTPVQDSASYLVERNREVQDDQDEPLAAQIAEHLQPVVEEAPEAVPEDEWALPTKQSKKDKRKAKKLKNPEEPPLIKEAEREQTREIAMLDNTEEPFIKTTFQTVESETPAAEPETLLDPDAQDERSFSRKPSKKEKRKAKKALTSNEEPQSASMIDTEEMVEPVLEPQHLTSETQVPEPSKIETQIDAGPDTGDASQSSYDALKLETIEPVVAETSQNAEGSSHEGTVQAADTIVGEENQVPQDIDFAATLAAGLQDSGFDPNLVIDDPVFHRRASPASLGEADPGEVTFTTTRRSKRNSRDSRTVSPPLVTSQEKSMVPVTEPTGGTADDGFADALTAGLVASGFAPGTLANISTDVKEVQYEPDVSSFAIPKRKKKNKKGRQASIMTPDVVTPAITEDSAQPASEGAAFVTAFDGSKQEGTAEPARDAGEGPEQSKDVREPEEAETAIHSVENTHHPTEASPKRLAKTNFFHTSEVSQFLPVRIDQPIQSNEERIDQVPQQSADVSTLEAMVNEIPRPTSRDGDAKLAAEVQPQAAASHFPEETPRWSFKNLEPPSVQRKSSSGQEDKRDDPFISLFTPEATGQTNEAEPVSPVESTTKDRTSYLFQSPVDVSSLAKAIHGLPEVTKKTRFHEPNSSSEEERSVPTSHARPQTPPVPLPPSPSKLDHVPLPPILPRAATPPAPLPPSPLKRPATPLAPLPPNPQPDQSPPLTRKKSIYDLGSPGPGHTTKAARRTATPQQLFREHSGTDHQPEVSQSTDRELAGDQISILRPLSSLSNLSARSNRQQFRSSSAASNNSAAPSLRRINRSLSGDLRAASRTHGPTTIPIEPPPTPPLQDEDFNGHGASRPSDMANIYEGWGDVRSSPTISPTRPPSMRKRQSMHILDLEAKLDRLASENRYLQDAIGQSTPTHPSTDDDNSLQEMLETRDLQLQKKDAEIQEIRSLLEPLQREIAKLTEVNNNLSEVNRSFTGNNDIPYATLQSEHANAHKQLHHTSQELEGLKKQHHELSDNMEDIVRQEIANALEEKNAEIRKLRDELDLASQQIRLLQSEILASKGDNYLTTRDEDYFDTSCQKLCQHVQQWVLRFSKYSDNRMCRLTSDLTDDKIAARLDNAILDGSDVDKLLGDRIRRRDVFMSVVMTMIWEYVFTRYLFGMDREQRQKLKSLEKILSEVGPPRAVAQWRATTLTLLSRRPAFATQRNLDTEAVAQEIFSVLSALLPPPAQLEPQILSSLRNVLRLAVELSIEMRSQKAEYIMLPPLQPEYDAHGDLVRKVHFNAALMNERSGEYTSNDELERSQAVVKIVLFPLVVKKGDDVGEGEDEIVVCPAQVLVAGSKRGKKVVRVLSGAMDIDNPRHSNQSVISGLESGGMI